MRAGIKAPWHDQHEEQGTGEDSSGESQRCLIAALSVHTSLL